MPLPDSSPTLTDRERHSLAEWLKRIRVYLPAIPNETGIRDQELIAALIKSAALATGQPLTPVELPACRCSHVRGPQWRPMSSCPLLTAGLGPGADALDRWWVAQYGRPPGPGDRAEFGRLREAFDLGRRTAKAEGASAEAQLTDDERLELRGIERLE